MGYHALAVPIATRYDFIVVGSGLAGLAFALHAAKHGSVCVLTKSKMTDSSTSWAQGGIAAAVGESDSWELHEQDTLVAGAGLCSHQAVRFLVQKAPGAIQWLRSLGADFDLNDAAELDLGREGGHSRHRIVHHRDKTGWEVERAVSAAVKREKDIAVFEHAFATGLILSGNRCIGVSAQVNELGERDFIGRAVMLATGGCGKVYAHTTNPRVATGDGIGLARRAGAVVENMEFMQFHPTTLHHEQDMGFLITEAVRGAGATLRNHHGQRFMYEYDQRLELAPRDVVARSIEREIMRLKTWCVYLDATHLPTHTLQKHFPTIWDRLRAIGINMERDWIPIVPAQHYSCGGIRTDLNGRTSLDSLYASGETASTGVHGANRLASNSLLEAMVFSEAAAAAAKDEPDAPSAGERVGSLPTPPESQAIRIRHGIQRAMSKGAGVFRTTSGLYEAASVLAELREDLESLAPAPFGVYGSESWNLLDSAELVVKGALSRKENVGLHFNLDLDRGPASTTAQN